MKTRIFYVIPVLLLAMGCHKKRTTHMVTPWGEISDSISNGETFDLGQIQGNGELIMLTMSGPSTCFDYKGKKLGTDYMLCRKFSDRIGVGVRVEICRDTMEMLERLKKGDGDIVAFPVPRSMIKGDTALVFSGARVDSLQQGWVTCADKPKLIAALNEWFCPSMVGEVRQEEQFLLSARSVRRHVFSPMLSRSRGIISRYDHLFMTYGMAIRWDWRLLAAQCYQESTFDPRARSWAGACGLMQIMPATADLLGLPFARIYDPESNIAAATKYLAMLESKFDDIRLRSERIKFVLACYNGGYNHIRDAMALARKNGRNTQRWNEVSKYVMLLSDPRYYNDPVVRYGYMRGHETVGYVERIHQRWHNYRSARRRATRR